MITVTGTEVAILGVAQLNKLIMSVTVGLFDLFFAIRTISSRTEPFLGRALAEKHVDPSFGFYQNAFPAFFWTIIL